MTDADKMFWDLNCDKYEGETRIDYVREGNDQIRFNKVDKLVEVSIWNGSCSPIAKSFNMRELKAINKKCEELGWL